MTEEIGRTNPREASERQLERHNTIHYLYLDECGNDSYKWERNYGSVNDRFLTLAGFITRREVWRDVLQPELDVLKKKHFGRTDVYLHFSEMGLARGAFDGMTKEERLRFWKDFVEFVGRLDCELVSITVDKQRIQEIYSAYWADAYNSLALSWHIEHLLVAMARDSASRPTEPTPFGELIIESRGDMRDKTLRRNFDQIYSKGSKWPRSISREEVQRRLSGKIGVYSKAEKNEGLEVADMVCNPLHWNTLFEGCPGVLGFYGVLKKSESVDIFWRNSGIQSKLAKGRDGSTIGYGIKLFPDLELF